MTTKRTPGGTGDGGRQSRPGVNQRVARIRGGLEKAVTGREHTIKRQARSIAERIDAKTAGRHHNKLHLALRAVELIVDNVSARQDRTSQSGAGSVGGRASAQTGVGGEPEDLGEFINLNDRR